MESVRRINAIKKMMAEGLTLEDIRRSFVFLKNHIDQVERAWTRCSRGSRSSWRSGRSGRSTGATLEA